MYEFRRLKVLISFNIMHDLYGSLEFMEILVFLFKAEIETTMALYM